MVDGFRLVMTHGPEPGQTFYLDKEAVSVGRDPGNDIVINHPQVSRQHARLVRRGGVIVLEDLGSTNGTFVNGMRLTAPHTLASGDTIGLGDAVTLTFYGLAAGIGETLVGRPSPAPPQPPQAYTPPPPAMPAARPVKKRRTGLWVGCGCATLAFILLLGGVLFYLDTYYPHILYAPLRWLGF